MTNQGDQVFSITCGGASSSVTVEVTTEDFEGSCVNPHNADIPPLLHRGICTADASKLIW